IIMVTQIKDIADLPATLSIWPDLGALFGISKAMAYQLVKQPGFTAVRVSERKIIIPKDKLMQFIEEQASAGLKK
ncbi:MAG: hypothetical protein R6U19_08900, partial [Bacteroidales bacterium]